MSRSFFFVISSLSLYNCNLHYSLIHVATDAFSLQGDYRIPYEFDPIFMRKEKLAFSILKKTASLLDDLKGRRHTHCMVDRIRGRDISLVVKVSCSIYSM